MIQGQRRPHRRAHFVFQNAWSQCLRFNWQLDLALGLCGVIGAQRDAAYSLYFFSRKASFSERTNEARKGSRKLPNTRLKGILTLLRECVKRRSRCFVWLKGNIYRQLHALSSILKENNPRAARLLTVRSRIEWEHRQADGRVSRSLGSHSSAFTVVYGAV